MNNQNLLLDTLNIWLKEYFNSNRSSADVDNYLLITEHTNYLSTPFVQSKLSTIETATNIDLIADDFKRDYSEYLETQFQQLPIDVKTEFLFNIFKKDEQAIRSSLILGSFEKGSKDVIYNYETKLLTHSDFWLEFMAVIVEHFKKELDDKHTKKELANIFKGKDLNTDSPEYESYYLTDLFFYNGLLYHPKIQAIFFLKSLRSTITKLKNKYRL